MNNTPMSMPAPSLPLLPLPYTVVLPYGATRSQDVLICSATGSSTQRRDLKPKMLRVCAVCQIARFLPK